MSAPQWLQDLISWFTVSGSATGWDTDNADSTDWLGLPNPYKGSPNWHKDVQKVWRILDQRAQYAYVPNQDSGLTIAQNRFVTIDQASGYILECNISAAGVLAGQSSPRFFSGVAELDEYGTRPVCGPGGWTLLSGLPDYNTDLYVGTDGAVSWQGEANFPTTAGDQVWWVGFVGRFGEATDKYFVMREPHLVTTL